MSLMLLSSFCIIFSSVKPNFPAFLLTLTIVALSLFTAPESQTNPNPNPVLNKLEAQKVDLPQARLHITDSRTARPVPAMPAENCVRSS